MCNDVVVKNSQPTKNYKKKANQRSDIIFQGL